MEKFMQEDLVRELDAIGFIFDPKIVYEGSCLLFLGSFDNVLDFDLNKDVFLLNSEKKNGVNLYKSFIGKYFYTPVEGANDRVNKYLKPILVSDMSDDGKKRFIKFNYIISLLSMVKDIGIHNFEIEESNTEFDILDYIYDRIKSKRDMFLNVIRKGKYSANYQDFLDAFDANNVPYSNEILQKEADLYTDMIVMIKRIRKVVENSDFDYHKFMDCFDIHKLYLIMSKIFIEESKNQEKINGKLNSCIVDACQYINTVKELNLHNYNPSIIYYDYEKKKIRNYTFLDLEREVLELISRHPEYKVIEINSGDKEVSKIMNNAEAAKAYAKRVVDRETLLANWEFVRKGTVDEIKEREEIISKRTYNKGVRKNNVDYYELLLEKKKLFESTSYLYRIVGKNKFEGYIGYVYSNGIVAFEKMYEDKEQTIPAKGSNAVYIMTIENFADFSKKTKVEIMEYIKSSNNPNVWRIYHNETMKYRLLKFINGSYYSEEVEEEIDKLINDEVLTKKLTD